ncbi:MAG: DNA repair protein NreA [Halobacteriaceae archaeon]
MRLDDYVDGLEPDEGVERRKLAEEKSYEILDHLDDVAQSFDAAQQGDSLFGSTAPSVFVGRHGYPDVSAGILSPMETAADAERFATSGAWYENGLDIDGVLQRRSGLLNSTRGATVDVEDTWDGFVGVQREVALADRPVDVEIGLSESPDLDFSLDDVTTPTGPNARAESADLAENPHVPKEVEKTLRDDDWGAEGAMTYLYRRDFDVYDINRVLSAGGLGKGENRRLVPTRWSITAVDDTVGGYLRGKVRTNTQLGSVEVWVNEYMGNRYWIVLAPGQWEFELVEMKSPGSVWNPDPEGEIWMASAHEGYEGRTGYVEETAGAYYAARLGVLEYLDRIDRQAKALVLREVSDDYWAPVGVWQIRESVRNAFDEAPEAHRRADELAGEPGEAASLGQALRTVATQLPVSLADLKRKSELAAGVQTTFGDFG